MAYTKILIAIDGSEFSVTAAKRGLELAHQLNAKSYLVFVVDKTKAIDNPDAGISSREALIVLKKEAEQMLDELARMYNGNEPEKFMPEGNPREDIIKMAETLEVDLIVLGTHGHTGLRRILVGSVAENIVRHSKIPVMVVLSKK